MSYNFPSGLMKSLFLLLVLLSGGGSSAGVPPFVQFGVTGLSSNLSSLQERAKGSATGTLMFNASIVVGGAGSKAGTVGQLTESLNGSTADGPLTLNLTVAPPSVKKLVLNPNNLIGGRKFTATITLSGPAEAGGSDVTLTSSNAAVAPVPASQIVAAGKRTATFTVTTAIVAGTKSATITAQIHSGPRVTAIITINPQIFRNPVNLTVNTGIVHQTWLAWRATATGPTFSGFTGSVPPAAMANILNDVVDLGMTGYRVGLFAGALGGGPTYDFSSKDAQLAQVVLPTRALVTAKGYPFSTYITIIGKFAGNWPWTNNPAGYGDMAAAFLSNYGVGGRSGIRFTPTYWVAVNEPDANGFACCSVSNGSGLFLYQNALAAKLQALGSSVKLELPDTVGPNSAYLTGNYALLTNPAQVGLLAWHDYDTHADGPAPSFAERNDIRTFAQSKGLPTGATEICCGNHWNGSYVLPSVAAGSGQPLGWARDIYWDMTEGDISVWEPLAIMGPCATPGCPGGLQAPITLDPNLTTIFKYQSYYALRQFGHYIRPGYKRVDMVCANCTFDKNDAIGQAVKPVAWVNPGNNKLVMVVVNDQCVEVAGACTLSQNVSISGLPANASFLVTGVDASQPTDQAFGTATSDGSGTLHFTFPPQAILTFVQQ